MANSPASADPAWIDAAVGRFERPLTLYASRLIGDADRARDVVQDTFLKLCAQDRAAVEPHLAEWLFTVCRNRALDVLRKEGPMTQLSDEQLGSRSTADPGPLDAIERQETAARVLALLEALPPNQREVIRLKFQNGFSYKEISRISGHSVSNVGFLIHVGMKTLKTRMGVLPIAPAPSAIQH
jgi:RNA polymerase sigma-70 factor (ECF subfamily)